MDPEVDQAIEGAGLSFMSATDYAEVFEICRNKGYEVVDLPCDMLGVKLDDHRMA